MGCNLSKYWKIFSNLRDNHFLILIIFYVPVEKVFHNYKANANQRFYERVEYEIAGRKNYEA